MKHLIAIILLFDCLVQCNGQTKNDSISFRKEIPKYQNGKVDLFYSITQQKVKQLNLDQLQTGFDSIQIRIWYDYSLVTLRKLLIIKRSNSFWAATLYTLDADWDVTNNTESIVLNNIETKNPKSGWNKFINDFLGLKVETLQNMNDIPQLFDGWSDGITYNVEIATKNKYRFYSYHVPEEFQDEFWQAKNMVDILKLIESEFEITWGFK